MLDLPLWFLTDRRPKPSTPAVSCDDPRAAIAFTTTDKVVEFLDARGSGQWKIALASDYESLVIVLAELHQTDADNICVDPNPDGSGGEATKMTELVKLCYSIKPK